MVGVWPCVQELVNQSTADAEAKTAGELEKVSILVEGLGGKMPNLLGPVTRITHCVMSNGKSAIESCVKMLSSHPRFFDAKCCEQITAGS